eukprot:jgi/Orpsp1_1/1179109/evm.model.c7180000067960.2
MKTIIMMLLIKKRKKIRKIKIKRKIMIVIMNYITKNTITLQYEEQKSLVNQPQPLSSSSSLNFNESENSLYIQHLRYPSRPIDTIASNYSPPVLQPDPPSLTGIDSPNISSNFDTNSDLSSPSPSSDSLSHTHPQSNNNIDHPPTHDHHSTSSSHSTLKQIPQARLNKIDKSQIKSLSQIPDSSLDKRRVPLCMDTLIARDLPVIESKFPITRLFWMKNVAANY